MEAGFLSGGLKAAAAGRRYRESFLPLLSPTDDRYLHGSRGWWPAVLLGPLAPSQSHPVWTGPGYSLHPDRQDRLKQTES